jgi:hypothetical protein
MSDSKGGGSKRTPKSAPKNNSDDKMPCEDDHAISSVHKEAGVSPTKVTELASSVQTTENLITQMQVTTPPRGPSTAMGASGSRSQLAVSTPESPPKRMKLGEGAVKVAALGAKGAFWMPAGEHNEVSLINLENYQVSKFMDKCDDFAMQLGVKPLEDFMKFVNRKVFHFKKSYCMCMFLFLLNLFLVCYVVYNLSEHKFTVNSTSAQASGSGPSRRGRLWLYLTPSKRNSRT